ncbi:adenosylmethionine--8-amino-7-oxononanoate aminotransferase BioA [Iodidimonas muriae]|uniref:Adenosylmethionine-8-amino-7-oxononanoate aminotransferase n=1 Tax=Iodidimonas muriae TaxID=261467 RepID=A0ABQ2L9Z6_9PROT|nr:adenosylmethionine--8-amino-7-oxononanoate transaminase [Iodidimonas muriae]GER06064.1 adenosylmethionine--8-amino-7-oxononanoate aminotransferase BioA [Kordiimonadales bacterium JCM 17843]GGO08096.1 adenosylmethionine--8-amino-7-oxononanoate aminotransferase BioA [Iodidimonas muriae]
MTSPLTDAPIWYDPGVRHLWFPYTQMKTAQPPLAVSHTEKTSIHLSDGRCLVDGIASWWTAAHGYNHPHILAAIKNQLERMPHVMFGGLMHEPAAILAQRLAHHLPGDLDRVFFAESGSVAVEVAMKMAAQYWINQGQRRHRFLFFRHGYHGDTLGTMAICDPDEGMHRHFRGILAQHIMGELPENPDKLAALDRLLAQHKSDLAAIIVEPLVQGAGGMRFHSAETLRALSRLAKKHGILLILDEIFTGFGRTGHMFACQKADLVPDIITLSKALTGGTLPLSAAIARRPIYEAFHSDDPDHALMHGPTYMAHALGCAAANASLDLFEREDRLGQARAIAQQMTAGLEPCRSAAACADVRVLGAIGVVELEQAPDIPRLRDAFLARGLWVRPLGSVIYLTPALTIDPKSLDQLMQGVCDVVRSL